MNKARPFYGFPLSPGGTVIGEFSDKVKESELLVKINKREKLDEELVKVAS